MTAKRTLTLLILLTLPLLLTSPSAWAGPQAHTYTVDSNASDADANPGDGVCATTGGQCTLYAAIQEANADGDASTINFASQFQGTNAIPGCGLPTITADWTTIDGSSQWDTAYGRPGVELTGSSCTFLTIQASNTTITGLSFGGSSSTGVHITGGDSNSIGGCGDGQRNVFLVGKYGVWIQSNNNDVSCNYFGTADGETLPGGGMGERGVFAQSNENSITGNLIVGQSDTGLFIWGNSNSVIDNIIGMTWNKSDALPNKIGMEVVGDYNIIGPNNVIAGNSSHGVYLYHADDNTIFQNYIGYPTVSSGKNGGDGVYVHVSSDNRIGVGNVIGPNTGNGIRVYASSGTTIQGNEISDNGQDGIHLQQSSGVQIGGQGDLQRNTIGGNGDDGIQLDAASNITVTNNYIGLDAGAFDKGNAGHGILIDNGSSGNRIGGSGTGEGNWIGWNHGDGIRLDGSSTYNNFILGNVIGAPVNWSWKASNGWHGIGIYNGSHDNYIGWDTPSAGNTILASGWSGVAIVGSNDNAVLGNKIGTNGSGVNWGNAFYGVNIVDSSGTSVKSNQIAYNGTYNGNDDGEAGVLVDGSTAINNMISGNSIHDNDGPGIALQNGGNHSLAAPVITSATCNSVQGTACANCLVEIFSDNDGEGRVYEGYFTTDASGHFAWSGTLSGPNATATATGPGSAKDTSPFASPFENACNKVFLPLVVRKSP